MENFILQKEVVDIVNHAGFYRESIQKEGLAYAKILHKVWHIWDITSG